jgi:hypothetical protein
MQWDDGVSVTTTRSLLAVAVVVVLGMAGLADAADGVVEINQERALAGGVTPGDAPGFPVTLSERGKYRLTSYLVVPCLLPSFPWCESHGIAIEADGVTVDLGGFGVGSKFVHNGFWMIWGPDRSRVTVQNGRLASPLRCSNGIRVGPQARVWNVRVTGCVGSGISLGPFSIVAGSTGGSGDGGVGLAMSDGIVSASGATSDFVNALLAGRIVLVDSTAGAGGTSGRSLSASRSVIRRTAAAGSGGPATADTAEATVWEQDRVNRFSTQGSAVRAMKGSSVSSTTIAATSPPRFPDRKADALVLDTDSSYRDNRITTDGGVTVTGGVDLGGNTCNGLPTCP